MYIHIQFAGLFWLGLELELHLFIIHWTGRDCTPHDVGSWYVRRALARLLVVAFM